MQGYGTRSLSSGARSRDPVALPTLRTQNGLTIPTRGIRVTIQPKRVVLGSFVEIGGTSFEPGKVFTACAIRNMQTAQFEIHRE